LQPRPCACYEKRTEPEGERNPKAEESVPIAQKLLQNIGGSAELGKFAGGQRMEMGREVGDTALAALLEKPCAFSRWADLHAAGVVGIVSDSNQAAASKSGDDAAHGGWLDLLGGGEFAESLGASNPGTGKDEYGEGRQLRGADSGGHILQAHAAQQVDGGGVKPVGGGNGFGPGRDVFRFDSGLDFCHRL